MWSSIPCVSLGIFAILLRVSNVSARDCTRPNKTELSYYGDGEGLPDAYEALATCPHITSLSVYMTWVGCVASSYRWSFDFKEGDQFPALRKLALNDYDFHNSVPWGKPRKHENPQFGSLSD